MHFREMGSRKSAIYVHTQTYAENLHNPHMGSWWADILSNRIREYGRINCQNSVAAGINPVEQLCEGPWLKTVGGVPGSIPSAYSGTMLLHYYLPKLKINKQQHKNLIAQQQLQTSTQPCKKNLSHGDFAESQLEWRCLPGFLRR